MLRLHFLSNVIPQTLNNEVLAETVPLKNLFVRTVSAKNEKRNIDSDFNYCKGLCLIPSIEQEGLDHLGTGLD